MKQAILLRLAACAVPLFLLLGCSRNQPADSISAEATSAADATETAGSPAVDLDLQTSSTDSAQAVTDEEPIAPPEIIEIQADDLLAAQLPKEELEAGWVRLFDGQSLAGWLVVGQADWQIADGIIKVSRGDMSYLCTSFQIPNYELKVDFRCDPETNSGIFLRTGPEPDDVAVECLELNIAPPDNPFPTGSFVQRKKLEPSELGEFDATAWHTFNVRLIDQHVQVSLDGKQIMELNDFASAPMGHISLQHNAGRVEFRNVLMRPIEMTDLKVDGTWQEDWTLSEKEPDTFSVESTDDGLKLSGGLGQLQTKREFADFVLQARYALAKPEVNTGIFFRCVPGAMLDGYECQVNHATLDGNPLLPADGGAGAIFRRQPARIVVGDGTRPTYITLLANGPQMVTWVNGIQVAEFQDTREPDENPRRGLRLEAGPVALQGHDATTEATFQRIRISEL